jgi:Domain of unknown function (DUF1854)
LSLRLQLDSFGRLVLTDARGAVHSGVVPVRAFPLSDPQHWIALCDAQGHELALIEDTKDLPAETRDLLAADLAGREFLPAIRRITAVSGSSEPCEWQVETDRGPTRFMLKSEDDVRRIGPHRALVIDADGVRYLVADSRRLDAFSRRTLERYI